MKLNNIDLMKDFNPHFRAGSDKLKPSIYIAPGNFNPHFRAGSDQSAMVFIAAAEPISIHTSAQEVT